MAKIAILSASSAHLAEPRFARGLAALHEDRNRSLSIRDGTRSGLVKYHVGCDPRDIMAALQRNGRWRDSRGPRREKAKPRRSAEDTRRYLLSIWRQCRPISGSSAGEQEATLKGEALAIGRLAGAGDMPVERACDDARQCHRP
jgi:hypothetical protein